MGRATKVRLRTRTCIAALPARAPAGRILPVLAAPPYSLTSPTFRFPALASLAGRAPLGGDRELVLACLMACRLAAGAVGPGTLPVVVRAERSVNAKSWLLSLALPAAARTPFVKLADAAAGEDSAALRATLQRVIAACTPVLDGASRQEVERFAAAVAASNDASGGPVTS